MATSKADAGDSAILLVHRETAEVLVVARSGGLGGFNLDGPCIFVCFGDFFCVFLLI